MFKFGFNNEETHVDDCSDNIKWHISCEILLGDILPSISKDHQLFYSTNNFTVNTVVGSNVLGEAIEKGFENILVAESSHSDLVPGKYEGGLKTWECSRDMADLMSTLDVQWNKLRVLDLGCGTGVLGIIALLHGSHVVFQDYNKEVLQLVTGRNILINAPDSTKKKNVRLYSGDWASFLELYLRENPGIKFDMILSSETIYNVKNYRKLHNVIYHLLAESGICYMANKCVYFGVGGSTHAFIDFIKKQDLLNVVTHRSQSEGVAREILKITHRHFLKS